MPKGALEILITADNKAALTSLKQTAAGIEGVSIVSQKATAKMADMAKGSNQAAQALTNVGRVAQDLPFGFMGIQNNLNPLLESFQRLKAESGSTGGALKALAGSLMGAGGLGLAVSVASSAFLIFGDRLFDSKKKTEEAATSIDDYRRSMMEANKEAAQSLSTVAKLVAADSLQNTSLQQKKKIIEDLQGISKEYFGNLKIEKGEISGLAQAYKNYADNIFRVAQAKVASKKIEELGAKLADVTQKADALQNKFLQSGGKQIFVGGAERIKELEKLTGGTYFENIQNIKRISELTGKSEKNILDYLAEKNQYTTEQLRLEGQIYGYAQKTATLQEVKPEPDKKSPLSSLMENYKEDIRALVMMLMEGGMTITEFTKDLDRLNTDTLKKFFKEGGDAASEFGKQLIALQPRFNEFGNIIQRGQIVKQERQNAPQPGLVVKQLEDKGIKQDQLAAPVKNLNEALTQTQQLMGIIGPEIDTLFNALANGVDIGQTVGDMFKNLALDIAKAAAKAAIFSLILSAISGGASNVAGAAGGGGFMKIFKNLLGLGGFAKGGVSYGQQGGHMELLHGTEAVLTPAQMSGLVRNSMNAGAVASMGSNGGQDMNISGEFVARGQDLVLALQRSNYSLNLRRG